VSTAGGVLEDIALIKLRGSSEDILDEHGQIDETQLMQEPLYAYSQYTSIQKLQSTYLPVLHRGTKYPINTSFETILETGRISSFNPNLNNLPRGGIKTLLQRLQARVRQCFVPRPGFVYCSVDYSAIELVGLAQVLIWFFGRSKMADAINEGLDLHLLFAAEQLLHMPYEEALKRKKEKHVADMRQMAKVANFSLGGGAGAATLCEMAKTSYNVFITLQEGKELIAKWKAQWPEMALYFRLINNMMRGFDEYGAPVANIESFVSGRMRGKARYCATANHFFQAIIADASKAALYALMKECYLLRGRLYGSRVVGYFYDEFFMEHPEETAHERAFAQTEIAVTEAQAILPDVKVRAAPALQPCWYKEADAVYNKAGRLICWVPQPLQTEDFYDDKGKLVSPMKQTLPKVRT
jgi:DNA polymerase I-like protein with 3'-5' exonuclease and polymerase domains